MSSDKIGSIFKAQLQFQFSARRPVQESQLQSDATDISIDQQSLTKEQSILEDYNANKISGVQGNQTELTRNDKYSVSQLNATPTVIQEPSNIDLKAYVDQRSNHACIASEDMLYIWNYTSVDRTPITFTIKVGEDGSGASRSLVTPVLVLPSPGVDEPGLVTIDTRSGATQYYETILSDSTVSLPHSKDKVSARIPLYHNEHITLHENIEPVGIVVATSSGRVFLVSLRDAAGKPHIKCTVVVSSSIIPFFRHSAQVVSIKGGKNLGYDARSLSIVTENADFLLYSVSRDGQVIKLYETSLKEHLLYQIKDFYTAHHIDILDSQPLANNQEDAFLILTALHLNQEETCYIIFTVKKDGDELLVFSTYRLTRYNLPYKSSHVPRLYLPKPGVTAFITFENAVVLVDDITKLNYSLLEARKWEDIVSLRSGIDIIGTGYEDYHIEDGVVINSPSVIAVTKEAGVLKIEKFVSKEDIREDLDVSGTASPTIMTSFTKSHIEQAVFYGYNSNNPLSFNVPENALIEESEIEQAIIDVGTDLVGSLSAYLPPRLSSIENHLELRLQKLKNLVEYIAVNFLNEISIDTKISVITAVEKVNAAYKIWPVFNQALDDNNQELIDILASSIREAVAAPNKDNKETIDDFFLYQVSKIGSFLSNVIQKLLKSNNANNYSTAVLLALKSIKEGAIDASTDIRQQFFHMSTTEIGESMSWIIEGDLCFRYNDLFHNYYSSIKDLSSDTKALEISKSLVSLVSVLFYSFSYGLSYYTSRPLTKATREDIQRYKSVYEFNRGTWIKSLVTFGEMDTALKLAEKFEDFSSLVEICDTERERVLSHGLSDAHVKQRFEQSFEKFGYRFAETLYNYYVFNGKLQELLLGFPEHNDYLKRFLASGEHGRVSWIRNILDQEYFEGACTLNNIANKTDDFVSNKKFQLSVAKLSLLAAEEQPSSADILTDIENGLTVLDLQNYLYKEVSTFKSSHDLVTETNNILSLLSTNLQQKNSTILYTNLRKPLTKLLSNKTVELNELVDLYMSLDIKTGGMKLDYYNALKLISTGMLTYSEKKISEILVWRRAILADDWKDIGTLKNKSPEYISSKIENSMLYITLLHAFKDNLFSADDESRRLKLPDVDYLIQPIYAEDLAKKYKSLSQKSLIGLNEELNKEVQLIREITETFDFKSHVKGIIGTAQKNSGSSKVVNYQTLQLADRV